MASTTVNIRCESQDIHDNVIFELEAMADEIRSKYGYEIDLNFDETKHGGRIIKITENKHANSEK